MLDAVIVLQKEACCQSLDCPILDVSASTSYVGGVFEVFALKYGTTSGTKAAKYHRFETYGEPEAGALGLLLLVGAHGREDGSRELAWLCPRDG
jgi:hypothetical protein